MVKRFAKQPLNPPPAGKERGNKFIYRISV
jgi:hypothetical protein